MNLQENDFQRLVDCVIRIESGFNPNAVSSKGAAGLMQLMPATGMELAEELLPGQPYLPFNPDQNRFLGSAYLRRLLRHFRSIPLALAAYNWGIGNVSRLQKKMKEKNQSPSESNQYEAIKNLLPEETRRYVSKILSLYEKNRSPYYDDQTNFADNVSKKPGFLG